MDIGKMKLLYFCVCRVSGTWP